jgi:Yip1 domain
MDDQHHNNAHEQNNSHKHESNSNNHGNMGNDFKKDFGEAMDTFKEIKHPSKLNVKDELENVLEVVKLNEKRIEKIANNKSYTTGAAVILAFAALATACGMYFAIPFYTPPFIQLLIWIVFQFIFSIVGIFAFNLVAKLMFKGKGDFGALFRTMGYAYALMIPAILMVVSIGLGVTLYVIGGIWMLIVSYKIILKVHQLKQKETILTIVAGAIVFSIVTFFVSRALDIPTMYDMNEYNSAVAGLNNWAHEIEDNLRDLDFDY